MAGGIERRSTESGWVFKLLLRGLPEQVLGEDQAKIRVFLRDKVLANLREFSAKPFDSIAKPTERRFAYWRVGAVLEPDFDDWVLYSGLDQSLSERDPWWEEEDLGEN